MTRKLSPLALCIPVTLVAMLFPTGSSFATDRRTAAPSTARKVENNGECRVPVGGEAVRTLARDRASVERSAPGSWRQNLKFSEPEMRLPMTGGGTVISPEGPAPIRQPSDRWLEGYRPNTPKAQAEYREWLKANGVSGAGLTAKRSPDLPPYHHNLLNPGSPQKNIQQPSGYVVKRAEGSHDVVEVKQLSPGFAGPKDGPPKAPGYVPRLGLTIEHYRQIKEIAANTEETPQAQDMDQTPATRAPSPQITAFDAIPGGTSVTPGVPPDPIMAAGLNEIVVVVNSAYRVYDKTGTPLTAAIAVDSFFTGVTECFGTFDPFIEYDEEFNRYVLGMDDLTSGGDSYFCIAVSQTADPTGAWDVWSIRSNTALPNTQSDFPHMGIGEDAVYITSNNFAGNSYTETRIYAINKSDLYAGVAVPMVAEASLGAPFTVQPVKVHGFLSGGWPAPGTPHHFIQHSGGVPFANLNLWRWVNPFSQAPSFYGSVSVENIGFPPDAPELDDANLNATSGDLPDAEYRGGIVYTTRTTACNFGGGSAESCIDWAKVDVTGGAPVLLEQQSGGGFGSANEFRYYSDIGVDRAGNVALGYTKSGPTIYTEIHVTGQEVGDPAGTLQVETAQAIGTGPYSDGAGGPGIDRFGDYSGMTIDPDGCTFWYVGEYSNGGVGLWETSVGAYKFPSCSVESLVNLSKGTFNCGEPVTVTVDDSIALTEAEVSAQTVVTTSNGDSETIPVGKWTGSGCTGNACTQWIALLETSGAAVSTNNGKINVATGGTITVDYTDPHGTHTSQSRTVNVDCQTRFEDGGFLVDGGCEDGEGSEFYRDYLDGGEFIAYTAGIFNPPSAPALTDVVASLSISGPASSLVTVYNPTVNVGAIGQGSVGGAVFYLFIDPAVDDPAFRLSTLDFDISITSPADGFTTPQVLNQQQLVQADDVIVNLSECFNFESGMQGFQGQVYDFSYTCSPPLCNPSRTITTVEAPWTFGIGCASETRTDVPDNTCDAGGTAAWKTNADALACGNFAQSTNTLMDDVLYSPVLTPANTGNAPSGQPWNWQWLFAEWFYRSAQGSVGNVNSAWAHYWDDDYLGVATPAQNEIDTYALFYGFFFYPNQDWDSSTPWDPLDLPANYDAVSFPSTASGEASAGLQWRWAFENFDADYGGNPTATAASLGTAIDNMQLFYDQFYAEAQVGACSGAAGTAAFDQFAYDECPGADLGIAVLDGDAGGSVTVTVSSDGTGDSETITITGAGPNYEDTLPYSTSDGGGVDDGILYVTPNDIVRISYDDSIPVATSTNAAFIGCPGGAVVVEGVAGLQDDGTGDGDSNADQNEIIDLSISIRNDTGNDLTNVRATISTADSTIGCMIKDSADFGTIAANGGTASNDLATDPFSFVVSNSAECTNASTPPMATFNVFVTADGLSGAEAPQTLTLRLDLNDLGTTQVLSENFDGGQPGGWVLGAGEGDADGITGIGAGGAACLPYNDPDNNWFYSSTYGNGGGGGFFLWNNSAQTFPNGTYDDLLDSVLISPAISIPAGGTTATLTFDHEYKFADASGLRADGAIVEYEINGDGNWMKILDLAYDGPLIFNTYCNPLCNGGDDLSGATPPNMTDCFHETPNEGENLYNVLGGVTVNWTTDSGTISGLIPGDSLKVRWHVGSMNSAGVFGLDTSGGYGLDNVLVEASSQECDLAIQPEVGCGIAFESASNLVQQCGDNDAFVEPGEEWSVDVGLVNETDTGAINVVADLSVNLGGAQATVSGNPGSYGALAPGASSTANFSFIVDPAATCLNNVDFDITNIVSNMAMYDDELNAFGVQVGSVAGAEVGFQGTDPLESLGPQASSILSPIFSLSGADSGMLSYGFDSVPAPGTEQATQDIDPLNINNNTASSSLSPAFNAPGASATLATVDWTSLTSNNVDRCAKVTLFSPGATASIILKDFFAFDLSPYNVLAFYQTYGPGQYLLELEDSSAGSCGSGFSELAGAVMTVDGLIAGGDWDANARVLLWDGSTQTIVKDFGVADANPYDISSLYTGPAQYEVRLEAQNGEGFRMNDAVMSISQSSCDVSNCVAANNAPPVADFVVGTGISLDKGVGANDLDITFDAATCNEDHAIVVYGDLGNFTGYQGAVDAGCNLGSTGSATFTHAGSSVWFNVLWVTVDDKAGHPGYDGGGIIRPWNAVGLCGATSDDQSDGVCN